MGNGGSHEQTMAQLESLPDQVGEQDAMRFLGKCFDRADWETICEGNDTVDKGTFQTTITLRNHAPSLRAWLEFWRLDELTEQLEIADVMTPTDLIILDQKEIDKLELKTIQKRHWQKAIAHAQYLEGIHFDKPPSPLQMWLESWRLGRLLPGLQGLGCDVKEDIVDLEDADMGPIGLRLLEERRWKQATEQLIHMIRKFDFNDDTRSSVPTLETWLYSLKLEELMEPLDDMGVVELADLADIDDRELASLNLNRLQLKHWKMGLFQALSAREEAALDGKLDMPTFRGWLESWRLGRLKPRMEQLGVYMQQDLLDLEPNEYQLLEMRPLEAKRFEQAMIALEEEFLTPAPDSDQEFRSSPGGFGKQMAVQPKATARR